jgi:hypothetical protein
MLVGLLFHFYFLDVAGDITLLAAGKFSTTGVAYLAIPMGK